MKKRMTLLVLALFGLCSFAWGQVQPEEVSKRITENLQRLRSYSWSTRTEIRLRGQQISVTLEKFRYDIDGHLQITPLGGSGKLSPELQPVVAELAKLGMAYAQPDPDEFAKLISKAEIWRGQGGTLRIEGYDFLRAGDYLDLRARNERAERISVESIYGSQTPVKVSAEFRALPDNGPSYVARMDVIVPNDGIEVFVENFDYVYNAPVAASDVSIIPAETELQVRLTGPLSSKQAQVGQAFEAVLDTDLLISGVPALKAGTPISGEVVEVEAAGRAQGKGKMAIRLTGVTAHGQVFPVQTNTLKFEAEGTGRKTARRLGGSAGIGALIGAIADGGSGAWKGAAIGAGVGGAAVLLTKGNEVEFPAEQLFAFSLTEPLEVGK